jgi:hypothetical protein
MVEPRRGTSLFEGTVGEGDERVSWHEEISFATNRHGTLNFAVYTIVVDRSVPTRPTTDTAADAFPDW